MAPVCGVTSPCGMTCMMVVWWCRYDGGVAATFRQWRRRGFNGHYQWPCWHLNLPNAFKQPSINNHVCLCVHVPNMCHDLRLWQLLDISWHYSSQQPMTWFETFRPSGVSPAFYYVSILSLVHSFRPFHVPVCLLSDRTFPRDRTGWTFWAFMGQTDTCQDKQSSEHLAF